MAEIRLKCTGWTVTVLFGTPTISAAVLWSISDGGILTCCWVDTYLCFGSMSCPFTKSPCATFNVIFPKVFAYRFYGLMPRT